MPGRRSVSTTLREKLAKVKAKLASATESDVGDEMKLTHKKIRSAVSREIAAAVKTRRARKRKSSR